MTSASGATRATGVPRFGLAAVHAHARATIDVVMLLGVDVRLGSDRVSMVLPNVSVPLRNADPLLRSRRRSA